MSTKAMQFKDEKPWTRPWRQYSEGNGAVLFYIVIVHALALLGLILFPLPDWRVLLVALLVTSIGGVGTSVCYHRSLSHGALRLHRGDPPGLLAAVSNVRQ